MNPDDYSCWGIDPEYLEVFCNPPKKVEPPALKPGLVTLDEWAAASTHLAVKPELVKPTPLGVNFADIEAQAAVFWAAYNSSSVQAPAAPAPKPPAVVFGKEPRRVIL